MARPPLSNDIGDPVAHRIAKGRLLAGVEGTHANGARFPTVREFVAPGGCPYLLERFAALAA